MFEGAVVSFAQYHLHTVASSVTIERLIGECAHDIEEANFSAVICSTLRF